MSARVCVETLHEFPSLRYMTSLNVGKGIRMPRAGPSSSCAWAARQPVCVSGCRDTGSRRLRCEINP